MSINTKQPTVIRKMDGSGAIHLVSMFEHLTGFAPCSPDVRDFLASVEVCASAMGANVTSRQVAAVAIATALAMSQGGWSKAQDAQRDDDHLAHVFADLQALHEAYLLTAGSGNLALAARLKELETRIKSILPEDVKKPSKKGKATDA